MTDADRTAQLLAELRTCEARAAQIRIELAAILGAPPPPTRPAFRWDGPVAPGTRGRWILETMDKLGGGGTRAQIASGTVAHRVGALLSVLGKKGYVARDESGWRLTDKGLAVVRP